MQIDGLVSQMRRGALEYAVMALLSDRPRYAFELVQILASVDGMLTTEGTMYPLLSRLRREGILDSEWKESSAGSPRRYYSLTPTGREALERFGLEWSRFKQGMDAVLNGGITK